MDWNDLRHFLALAREGSVRSAGAQLGVSHSTVARRVESLESELSTRLFDRDRDGYTLTQAGELLRPRAEHVEREMAALERDLVGLDKRLAGTIRMTCCDEWVSDMMMGPLTRLCRDHPEIELEFTADSRSFDLTKREADIAVRILEVGATPPEHLIGKKLVPLTIASYVSAEHARQLDPALTEGESRWLAFNDHRTMRRVVADSGYPDLPMWGTFTNLGVMVQAVRNGLGISALPTYIADPDPTLRRLQVPAVRHMADLWLLSHPDLRNNARLRLARSCVSDAIRAFAPIFRGDEPQSHSCTTPSRR
ncbi:MAG: LysR family transcriptional regulator [Myxococcota bacterium]